MFKEFLYVKRKLKACISQYSEGQVIDSKMYLAGKSIIENVSFRLPDDAKNDSLIAFKQLYRTIKLICVGNSNQKNYEFGDTLILDSSYKFEKLELDYIKRQSKHEVSSFLIKSDMLKLPVSGKGVLIFLLFLYSIPIIIRSLFNVNKRTNYALLISEIAENVCFYKWLNETKKIKIIYDFIPFEKDGNFMALLIFNLNIKLIKVPSPGPLAAHNQILITNQLILSSQYQFEELPHFKETIIADEVVKWLPEYAFNYIDKYAFKDLKTHKSNIGFYSHGSWLRELVGDVKNKLKIENSESKLLEDLKIILLKNKDVKLLILPHPKEKNKKYIERTIKFYDNYLKGINYEILMDDSSTADKFNVVDIAISPNSTVLYERLFCGYKTLIGCYDMNDFPVSNSNFSNITFRNLEELKLLLNKSLKQSQDEFFKSNNLIGYRYFEYDFFKNK